MQPIDVAVPDPRLDAFRGIRDRELRGTLGLHAIESERVVRRFLTAALRRRAHPMPPVLEPHALLVGVHRGPEHVDRAAERRQLRRGLLVRDARREHPPGGFRVQPCDRGDPGVGRRRLGRLRLREEAPRLLARRDLHRGRDRRRGAGRGSRRQHDREEHAGSRHRRIIIRRPSTP